MRTFGYIVASLFGLAALLSLAFGLTWLGIEWRGFFGPRRAAVERRIFEETRSYQHGMRQDLVRYRMEYLLADTQDEKDAIASTVRMRFAEFDTTTLSPELQAFWALCSGR